MWWAQVRRFAWGCCCTIAKFLSLTCLFFFPLFSQASLVADWHYTKRQLLLSRYLDIRNAPSFSENEAKILTSVACERGVTFLGLPESFAALLNPYASWFQWWMKFSSYMGNPPPQTGVSRARYLLVGGSKTKNLYFGSIFSPIMRTTAKTP